MAENTPTQEQLAQLNAATVEANKDIGIALSWLFTSLGWTQKCAASKILGTTPAFWQKYREPASKNNRQLHAISALSWVSGASMTAMFRPGRLSKYWLKAGSTAVDLLVTSGELDAWHFESLIISLVNHSNAPRKEREIIYRKLSHLSKAPQPLPRSEPIDLKSFKPDYHRAMGIGILEARLKHNMTEKMTSSILGASLANYRRIESAGELVERIPATMAIRYKLCFPGENTTDFLRHLEHYKGFYDFRRRQENRERILIETLKFYHDDNIVHISRIARALKSAMKSAQFLSTIKK